MTNPSDLSDKILACAITLAENSSWETLCLHHIAHALDIPLQDIHRHFSVKDDLVEAWYDRADSAMLHAAQASDFSSLNYRQRLCRLIMAWLDFLAQHKTVSRDMLLYKLEPAHIHLQLQGLLRISATVQWLREAAQLEGTHLQRIAEEIGLTGIYVNTTVYWLFDLSEEQVDTRRFLARQLARAERFANTFFSP
ncbi:MAG: TetR/AcrR family transcriptional regulator [Gammaproteobacteria bacterium]